MVEEKVSEKIEEQKKLAEGSGRSLKTGQYIEGGLGMNGSTRPVLSISMLVSNGRRDTIERCMESLVPLRRAVPSELILVDTGCTDGSIEIAASYADKVVKFTWCNDFSAARNAGLCECTGEWFLYLDDDEWFEDVTELIEFFQGQERKHCDALWYLQRNYTDLEGAGYTDTYVGRVVRLTPETRFHGKIHEWLEPVPRMIKKTNAYVHHYGYIYKNEEERQRHLQRNLSLEEEAVRENPDDIRMCCQLVQEYRAAKRYDDARKLCRTTLETTKYPVENSFVQALLLVLPKIDTEQENYQNAVEEFERLEREAVLLHQTKLGLSFEKARALEKLGRKEEMFQACKDYLEEYDTVPKAGAPAELPVMDFAHYCSRFCRQKVVKLGVRGVLKNEDYTPAEYFFEKADWTYEKGTTAEFVPALLQCYIKSGNAALLTKNLPRILEVEDLRIPVSAALFSVYEQYPEKRNLLAADLEPLALRSGNFAFFHLLFTEARGITTQQDVTDYYEKSDRKYDAEVAALLFLNAELFPKVLETLSIELYTEAAGLLLKEMDRAAVEGLWQHLPEGEAYYPEEKKGFWRYTVMATAEKRLVLAAGSVGQATVPEQGLGLREALDDYIAAVKQYSEAFYRPELLTVAGAVVLPANIRFSYAMEQALAAEDNMAVWGEGMKQAAKEYPAMLPVVRGLLAERKRAEAAQKSRKSSTAAPAGNAQRELLALAGQLKGMVQTLFREGKAEEATAILSELATMLPDDEEVKELLKNSCTTGKKE